jgi:hypothetical protein
MNIQMIADRAEIEALRAEFTDAGMMRDYDRLASLLSCPNCPGANTTSPDAVSTGFHTAMIVTAAFGGSLAAVVIRSVVLTRR